MSNVGLERTSFFLGAKTKSALKVKKKKHNTAKTLSRNEHKNMKLSKNKRKSL